MRRVRKPPQKTKHIVVHDDIAAMANMVAAHDSTSVAEVVRPLLLDPLRKRIEKLSEVFRKTPTTSETPTT